MKNFKLHAFADEAGQDLNEQIAALRDNGYEGMEIRNVEGQNVSALTLERAKEIDKRMKDAGLCVWSIGSPIGKISLEDDFEKHMDLYKHTLEVAAVFGAQAFRLFSFYMPKDETDFSKYKNEVIPKLMEKYNYSTVMQVPKLEKIVINIGVGDATENDKYLDAAVNELQAITGAKPVITKAKSTLISLKGSRDVLDESIDKIMGLELGSDDYLAKPFNVV